MRHPKQPKRQGNDHTVKAYFFSMFFDCVPTCVLTCVLDHTLYFRNPYTREK